MASPHSSGLDVEVGLELDLASHDETKTSKPSTQSSVCSSEGKSEELPGYYKTASEHLIAGIKADYLADMNQSKSRVRELVHNQDVLRESLQQEMTNLEEYKLTDDIAEFANSLKSYHSKLLNVKRDIQYVNDKVAKMKKKSVKLQIGKQKEELHKAHQKQKELEFQKQLTAKPAAGSFSD